MIFPLNCTLYSRIWIYKVVCRQYSTMLKHFNYGFALYKQRILQEWSLRMKIMKQAFGDYLEAPYKVCETRSTF